MMLKRSSRTHAEALKKLDKIREQKKIETTMHKILKFNSTHHNIKKNKKRNKLKTLEKSGDNVMLTHYGHP